MECPYFEMWEVTAPLSLRAFCELLGGSLALPFFEYDTDDRHERGHAVLQGQSFEIRIRRWHDYGKRGFEEPFTIVLEPQYGQRIELPISLELREQAKPWIIQINIALNQTGCVDDFSDFQNASQTSLKFWDNPIDDETWNDL